jgi:GNAT superfamily N-acetyltransferase
MIAHAIGVVRTGDDLAAAAGLFRAYAASLEIDLGYQDFDAELATLPGKYAAPAGVLLLARDPGGRGVGCVGLRPLEPDTVAEMKRLYVAPEARGAGLGARLVQRVIEAAETIGYREIRLDTLPTMTGALGLYARFGFEPMPAYYDTPIAGTRFLRRELRPRVRPGSG